MVSDDYTLIALICFDQDIFNPILGLIYAGKIPVTQKGGGGVMVKGVIFLGLYFVTTCAFRDAVRNKIYRQTTYNCYKNKQKISVLGHTTI